MAPSGGTSDQSRSDCPAAIESFDDVAFVRRDGTTVPLSVAFAPSGDEVRRIIDLPRPQAAMRG